MMLGKIKKKIKAAKKRPVETAVKAVEGMQKRMGVKKIKGKRFKIK